MEILKINSQNFKRVIEKVIKFIKEGKVIVFPTDTVYGLIANATDKKAVEKIFKIKKRKKGKEIPIFVKDLKMAKKLAKIEKSEEEFLKKVWPGKVTVILKKKNQGKIGLRIPKYRLVNLLLEKLKKPLTGTSANISGRPASTEIKKIIKQFENQKIKPDLIVDAGNLKPAKPSTVIDLTTQRPKIQRKGEISKRELLKLLSLSK
jgi:L-threonylcarbamoyladenylate synthase